MTEVDCSRCIHKKLKWYQGFFERRMKSYCEIKGEFVRIGYWMCDDFEEEK